VPSAQLTVRSAVMIRTVNAPMRDKLRAVVEARQHEQSHPPADIVDF